MQPMGSSLRMSASRFSYWRNLRVAGFSNSVLTTWISVAPRLIGIVPLSMSSFRRQLDKSTGNNLLPILAGLTISGLFYLHDDTGFIVLDYDQVGPTVICGP